jgi:hypothetical protein
VSQLALKTRPAFRRVASPVGQRARRCPGIPGRAPIRVCPTDPATNTIRASCRGTRPLVSPSLTEPRDDSRCKGLWPNSPVRIGGFASDNVTRPALTLAGMSFAIALSCGRRPSRPPVAQCASHPPKRAERPVRSWGPGASLGVLGEYGLPRRGDAVAWHAPRLPLVKLGLHGAHPPALRW